MSDGRRTDGAEMRRQARAAGLKRYNTGRPCVRGHLADRLTANGGCAECLRRPIKKVDPPFYMPVKPLQFDGTTATEAALAYLLIEESGWHLAAVERIRADPSLAERLKLRLTKNRQRELELCDAKYWQAIDAIQKKYGVKSGQ